MIQDADMKYSFEFDTKLRACFIGAGGHSFRNIYPSLKFAPIDLVGLCDLDVTRARAFAREFGASRYYDDYREMLQSEQPEIVFIVTGKKPDGTPLATEIARDALRMGVHVWMEKPTAATLDEVAGLRKASSESGKVVMTGLKKLFFPSIAKVKQIVSDTERFGAPSSIYVRYPQSLPELAERGQGNSMEGFLDHIYHPAAILFHLMGEVDRMSYEWEPWNGGTVANFRFRSGAIGTMHLAAGQSGSSPLERLEVVGQQANVVVENGVHVRYYRRAEAPKYGRSASYLVDEAVAPLIWEPEFSLGQLYNKNLFYLGYVPEILHFCEAVTQGSPIEKGTLDDVEQIVKLYEVFRKTPPGVTVTV